MSQQVEVVTWSPGHLQWSHCQRIIEAPCQVQLAPEVAVKVNSARAALKKRIQAGDVIYGVNTGFGRLASTRIAAHELSELQQRMVLSHATGTGPLLPEPVLRLLIVLKINALAQGYSGVRMQVIQALIDMLNAEVYPCIPAKGSVGASGDLAPLAHLACALLGVGDVHYKGERMPADAGLAAAGITPLVGEELQAKEGLALLNGTQVSTALAAVAVLKAHDLLHIGIMAGALSLDACLGSAAPFDERVHAIRRQPGQIAVAAAYRHVLQGSAILASHRDCSKVQDPYSLRCQPQVLGACWEQLQCSARVIAQELNAVSDNPLVFAEGGDVVSAGNFHAEPVAIFADGLAVAIAEMGALSERRIALLMDSQLSGLPAFLVKEGGTNSGFMLAQVTAAALASENKSLAHPASVDSLPTSANQEDHVSMATYAARRLHDMLDNVNGILAIECLAAAQGIDFRAPLLTSPLLQRVHQAIRQEVAHYAHDRYFHTDIEAVKQLIDSRALQVDNALALDLPPI